MILTHLRKKLTHNLLAFGMFAAVVSVAQVVTPEPTWTSRGALETAAAPDPVAAFFADHDCWTGKAPADVYVPGHVVLTRGSEGPEYLGDVWVGKALDQLFNDVDSGIVAVHGFCR